MPISLVTRKGWKNEENFFKGIFVLFDQRVKRQWDIVSVFIFGPYSQFLRINLNFYPFTRKEEPKTDQKGSRTLIKLRRLTVLVWNTQLGLSSNGSPLSRGRFPRKWKNWEHQSALSVYWDAPLYAEICTKLQQQSQLIGRVSWVQLSSGLVRGRIIVPKYGQHVRCKCLSGVPSYFWFECLSSQAFVKG